MGMDNTLTKSIHPRLSINQLLCELHTRLTEHSEEFNSLAKHLQPIRNLHRATLENHKEAPFENASYIEDVIREAVNRLKNLTERVRDVRSEIALEPMPEDSVPTPEREVTYPTTLGGTPVYPPRR